MTAEIITWICLTVLSMIGLTVIVRAVSYALIRNREPFYACYLVLLSGDNADMRLRSALECVSYKGLPEPVFGDCGVKIMAVDCGLCSDMKKLCKMICSDCNIDFCEADDIKNEIYHTLIK